MNSKPKNNPGGRRKGSGRKKKFGEKTITKAFRMPKSKWMDLHDQIVALIDKHKMPNPKP
jgi:hypothetical protein